MNLSPQEMELAKYAITAAVTGLIGWFVQRRKTKKAERLLTGTCKAIETYYPEAKKKVKLVMEHNALEGQMNKFIKNPKNKVEDKL